LEPLLTRVCGCDVHRDTVCACVIAPGPDGKRQEVVRTFGTTTAELLKLRDWLAEQGVTHVAMESTGVFWKPVYYILEDGLDVMLVNAAHVKNVPGRKTDLADATWIAQLLEHGLLRPSFVPPPPIRELRDLTRYRKTLIEEHAREANRIHKVLQDAGIKLSSVATDALGVSGRAMMKALIEGQRDPTRLASLAKGKLKSKKDHLKEALHGRFRPHHAVMLSALLAHIDFLQMSIDALGGEIDEHLVPFAQSLGLLQTIPGVGKRSAEVIIAETGGDMSRFPTAGHLASWAGLCPGNNQSGGKRLGAKVRDGNPYLRTVLIEGALTALRKKTSFLRARYYKLKAARGHKTAIVAVAHQILVAVWHVLSRSEPFKDLGADYYKRRNPKARIGYLVRQLQELGVAVDFSASTSTQPEPREVASS
jgi:transposase